MEVKPRGEIMKFDDLKSELLSVIDTGLKFGKSLDNSVELEIYMSYESESYAQIAQGMVTTKDGITSGNAVRAAKGKRVGFACASGVSLERLKFSIKEAMSIIEKVSVENERFQGFCDAKTPNKEGALADDILEQEIQNLVGYCVEISDEASGIDDRVNLVNPEASTIWGGYAIGNTRGVQAGTRYVKSEASLYVMSTVGEERKTAYEYDIARDRLFDIQGLGEKTVKECISQHDSKKLDQTTTMTTIWAPKAAASYLLSSLGQAILGQPVVEQISPLCDRIGEVITSKEFTVVDDGQSPDSLGANAVDSEGHPQYTTSVVESGVLKSFLFDTYYARAFGMESTGNCARGGGVFGGPPPFEIGPSASTKRLRVSPGKDKLPDLISNIDGPAILIKEAPIGIFHSSVSTGEFSSVANEVFFVDNGEIKHPLLPVSVSGQYYEGLSTIRSIGSDVSRTYLKVDTPTIVIDDFSVVG